MTTYAEDYLAAVALSARWHRKLMTARTKCRKLNARIWRLRKLVQAGVQKKPRRAPGHLYHPLPVVRAKITPPPIIED
ncbi:MAG TPA: hypothetical protein VGP72_05225 [Planctomycetota bacterium]|jgi:hypothetical protein